MRLLAAGALLIAGCGGPSELSTGEDTTVSQAIVALDRTGEATSAAQTTGAPGPVGKAPGGGDQDGAPGPVGKAPSGGEELGAPGPVGRADVPSGAPTRAAVCPGLATSTVAPLTKVFKGKSADTEVPSQGGRPAGIVLSTVEKRLADLGCAAQAAEVRALRDQLS